MASLGLSDILSLVQTVAIIAALIMTLYFSRQQMRSLAVDMETRVLNDLDKKVHRLIEIFIDSPQMIKIMYNVPADLSPELALSYYVQFICSHIYHMRQRRILSDNEWAGWLQWMKNAFQYGTIEKFWKEKEMESWFDPSFREFVNKELMRSQAPN